MREHLKNYFNFSKTEKRGILVLSSFLLFLIGIIWLKPFQKKVSVINFDETYNEQIAQFYLSDSLKEAKFKSAYKPYNYSKRNYTLKEKVDYKKAELKIEPFDINLATAEDYKQIKGLGEVLSTRIIQYREKLGGFYSINQLKEVYGLDSTLIQKNNSIFILNSSQMLKKLDINNTEFKVLLKHPYLEYDDVKKIFKLKDSLKVVTIDDLKGVFTKKKLDKISPYLK